MDYRVVSEKFSKNLYCPAWGLTLVGVPLGSGVCDTCGGRGFNFEGDLDPSGPPLLRWAFADLRKVTCPDCKGLGYLSEKNNKEE